MSDSVVKLRIDSKEYDANIKRAGDALTEYFRKVREGSRSLDELDADTMSAVRAMGELGTLSDNTKGGLRELTQAITDMTVAYRSLTDEEKNSPLGQAMQQSIQQMTDRAGVMKDAMVDVQNAITKTASDTRGFDQMAGAVTFATSAFQSLQGAGKLLGIEMGNNVEVIAKLQAAMAITNGLTQMQALLQKESAFMQGVTAAKAAISATAHGILAGEITAATIAQKALNAAMAATPWGLAALAVYAVVDALNIFSSDTDTATSKQAAFNVELENMKRRIDDITAAEEHLKMVRDYLGGQDTYHTLTSEIDRLKRERQQLAIEQESHTRPLIRNGNTQPYGYEIREGHQEAFDEVTKQLDENEKKLASAQAKLDAFSEASYKFRTQWESLSDPREIKAAIAYWTEEFNGIDTGKTWDVWADSVQKIINTLQGRLRKLKTPGSGTTNTTATPKTEEQENSAMITKLVEEYQKLATAEKTADEEQKKGIADRKTAIQGEIKTLTERNAELKKFADEAKGLANVKPVEWVKGLSGFNAQTMSAWMQGRQGDLQKVDYGTADYKAISGNIADMTAVKSMLESTIKNAIDTTQIDMTQLWEKIFGEPVPEGVTASLADVLTKMYEQAFDETDISDTAIQSVINKINEALEEKGIKLKFDVGTGSVSESKIENKSGKKNPYITENADGTRTVKATQLMSGMSSGIMQMANGIKDLGFKIPSGFEKAAKGINDVVSVLQGITTITQVISAIVTAIEAMTAIQTTESSIKSIPVIGWALAGGGMIRAASGTLVGNSFSGDNLRGIDTNGQLYGLNAGEIVLNRAQQGVLADMINSEDRSVYSGQPYVTGEAIYLGLHNYTRRRGLGEVVTSRRG